MIEQAIGNVIGNAIAHTPAQTRIVIDTSFTPDRVTLSVTDNGPGIPPEALPAIFDKFVKAERTGGADGGQGTGLGLAIAKGIIEAHGGTIGAESPSRRPRRALHLGVSARRPHDREQPRTGRR